MMLISLWLASNNVAGTLTMLAHLQGGAFSMLKLVSFAMPVAGNEISTSRTVSLPS